MSSVCSSLVGCVILEVGGTVSGLCCSSSVVQMNMLLIDVCQQESCRACMSLWRLFGYLTGTTQLRNMFEGEQTMAANGSA